MSNIIPQTEAKLLSIAIAHLLKELLSTKHLYQSVSFSEEDITSPG